MTRKAVGAVAAGVFVIMLLCSGIVGSVFGGGGGAGIGCGIAISGAPPDQTPSVAAPSTAAASTARPPVAVPSGPPQAPGYTDEQLGNATAIVTVGRQKNIPPRGWVIAVATALQESSLRNLSHGDRDSVGLFQQRPSQGWGTPAQLQDPTYAAGKFYDALTQVEGWQQMTVTNAAQAVQKSALPDAYAKWETDATTIVAGISGMPPGALAGCGIISSQGWTQPLRAPVSSGFRTAERPGHDGVDLMAPKGTPIHAASAGVVRTVRCNIRPESHGCDQDGSPMTPGCGWYVDIEHADRVITRYCHMLRRPDVTEGRQVAAGQVIGVSGNSGHSSGPHLHFEVHLGDGSALSAVDPVAWMRDHGAPLS
jgi:murein DD-endopeptidase MepM/ murein hydrolase activator NlpD